ncbi:DUF4139 domain-containing protein [Alkalihalobacterium chitinilyticum]|uniref:DUF4139 domain-containing protein n=1 Tax=Alkalihalobacterium chitinilyticum TaxID=2980103 RepID=A0ABT5VCS2_9BACI|nr:DUF4139 domain-containing protein [Alkalihalobacterium chitinilyticum]MDE5413243.1 DUF4139 domain-containing protein [Alkalihalobacterium chitinilyticum]
MRLQTTNEDCQKLSITIYNDGFGLVKEERKLYSTDAISEVQYVDVAEKIETDSIIVSGLKVEEFNFDYDLVNQRKLLEKYLEQVVTVHDKERGDKTRVRLLSVTDGIIGEIVDTKEIIINPVGELILPSLPSGLMVKPALIWNIKPQWMNHEIKVSYLTKGIQWNGNYVLELQHNTFQLTGWVQINNQSGTTYNQAQLKLIAGEVNRVHDIRDFDHDEHVVYSQMSIEEEAENFTEKSFADQQMYTLSRPVQLKNQQEKQINFLNIANGEYKKYYVVDRYTEQPPIMIEMMNSKDNQMGIPLPKGKVKVYQEDESDQTLEFIGEDEIPHTPKDELVTLTIGKAFDIVTDSKEKKRYRAYDFEGEYEYVDYEYVIKNKKDEPVMMKIEHSIYERWSQIMRSSHSYEQENTRQLVFWVEVPANQETIVSFTYEIDQVFHVKVHK